MIGDATSGISGNGQIASGVPTTITVRFYKKKMANFKFLVNILNEYRFLLSIF